MKKRTQRQIIATATILFVVGSFVPFGRFGCLHHSTLDFGFPLPWLAVDVQYGKPERTVEFYEHGPIEKIEGVRVQWGVLPFSIVANLMLAAVFVGVGKGASRVIAWCRKREKTTEHPAGG